MGLSLRNMEGSMQSRWWREGWKDWNTALVLLALKDVKEIDEKGSYPDML